jgi:ribose transport system ATP-binding protein
VNDLTGNNVILSLKHITKTYPGVTALNDISIGFFKGEVHALLGENGAGKSTLIKVISGAVEPDEGEICFGETKFSKLTPYISRKLGVETIYQEYNLIESLSAAENICLGGGVLGRKAGLLVNRKEMARIARDLFSEFHIDIDPEALVRDLPSAQQQIIEIAKAVSKNASILIMDEPTAPLAVYEVDRLMEIIGHLKKQGVTVIYISHRIEEIFRIADRVTIMRDGCYIDTKSTKETSRKELINLMVGRELTESFPERKHQLGEVLLEAKDICGNGVENISFSVRKGEILGIAGLVGSGRTELIRAIYGADRREKGRVLINGKPVTINSPKDAIELGIGLIPEDRKHQGCFLDMDIKWNISIVNIKNISKGMVVDSGMETETAEKYKDILEIKTPTLSQRLRNLSGGNQQKVVIAKTLAANSNILFFDEPTRGIDVGTKQEIYQLMNRLASEGKAIVMISSDMEELLGMSDRIVVLCEGQYAGDVPKSQFNQDYILDLASGGRSSGVHTT